jgi:hypothetical protein
MSFWECSASTFLEQVEGKAHQIQLGPTVQGKCWIVEASRRKRVARSDK